MQFEVNSPVITKIRHWILSSDTKICFSSICLRSARNITLASVLEFPSVEALSVVS
jgi:hypothetical protein